MKGRGEGGKRARKRRGEARGGLTRIPSNWFMVSRFSVTINKRRTVLLGPRESTVEKGKETGRGPRRITVNVNDRQGRKKGNSVARLLRRVYYEGQTFRWTYRLPEFLPRVFPGSVRLWDTCPWHAPTRQRAQVLIL